MTQLSKILLYFGFLICLYQAKDVPRILTNTYIKAYKMECDFNSEYIDNLTCYVKPINWTRGIMNFRCDLKVPLRNLSFNAALYKRYSEFRPYLLNFTLNACDFLNNKANKIYARAIYKYLKPLTNLNHSCPYEGAIIANNMVVKESYIPAGMVLPTGKFKTTMTFTEGYPPVNIGFISVYAEVFERRMKFG